MRVFSIALLFATLAGGVTRADDWPQFLGPQRDGVWRETGIVDKLPATANYRWRQKVGEGYAGPAVADGRVFVSDFVRADGEGAKKGKGAAAGQERLLCLDERTGEVLWTHAYDCTYNIDYASGPRCTPAVDGDRVYNLGAMGDLHCLDVRTGKVLWKKNFTTDFEAKPAIWGFAASPLVDGDKVICLVGGTEGRGVIAFNKSTGAEIWKALTIPGDPGYCAPVIFEIGKQKKRELIIWEPHAIAALDPETGKRFWSQPWEIRASLTVPQPRLVDGNKLFLTAFYNGSMLLKVEDDTPTVLWKSKKTTERADQTEELHSIISTPVVKDGFVYGVCSYGEMRCIKLDNGERVWSTYEPVVGKSVRWGNAFIYPHEDRYFLFNELGDVIICKLAPEKYDEISRLKIIEPTNHLAGRPVVWMQPAFANKHIFARNDKEIVSLSLGK